MHDWNKNLLLLATLALGVMTAPVMAGVHKETKEHRFNGQEIAEISVLNLAGNVELKAAPGDELVVRATFNAEGTTAEEARQNAELLSLDIKQNGKKLEMVTVYPTRDHDEFVYLRDDKLGGLLSWGSRTTTTYQGRRVSIRSGGRGLALHADYEILVPAGTSVRFDNKVGAIRADSLYGDLQLDSSSGGIRITGGKGEAHADTGSGRIDVSGRTGKVFADSGSGGVTLRDIKGDIEADTGSGSVEVTHVTGEMRIDTGSGGVVLENVAGNLWVDTGSGSVQGRNLQNVRELEIDTGSGSVRLEGDFSGLQRMKIDTGSGGVRMKTKGTLNMQLAVSTGSGGTRVDLPEMKNVRSSRGEFEAEIGNGKGRGVIDTGSGGVRISSQ